MERFGWRHSNSKLLQKNIYYDIARFFVFHILLSAITIPMLIFYGPFSNLRSVVTGMSWNSLQHRYISRLFLPEADIREILDEQYPHQEIGQAVKVLRFSGTSEDRIELYDVKGKDYKGKLIVVTNPLRIAVGYSEKLPAAGEVTSQIAKRNKAAAAINAGGFNDEGAAGTGGAPMGVVIHKGRIVYNQQVRTDILQDIIGFTKEGMLIVGMHSVDSLMEYGIYEAVSFGPPLVVNGEPVAMKGDGGWGLAPRTVIGQRSNGEVLLLVVDGRDIGSVGVTLRDIQEIMLELGAENAANLDGGASTAMYLNGRIINQPSGKMGERAVPSIFMVLP